jgi:hypothetical protein
MTPPEAFTHFHQDGHGTVDSGHQCLSGYNEIVILRRLTERHKRHALQLLNGEVKRRGKSKYDGLYGLPHGDGYVSPLTMMHKELYIWFISEQIN